MERRREKADVGVGCFTLSGMKADTPFSLRFVGNGSLPSPSSWGAYARAQKPTTASYVPAPGFTSSSDLAGLAESQWQMTAKRSAVGRYSITYPYMPPGDKTIALVTAIGADSAYCNVSSLGADGDAGVTVGVRCYTSAGVPVDTQYSERYLYNSFIIF